VTALRNALDDWEPEDQMLLMQFMSAAEFLEMDNQGRILIQKRDLEAIGIGQDIVFVGLFDRFALWSPDKFEEKKLESRDLSDRIRARMKKG
jgi:MraZ protein